MTAHRGPSMTWKTAAVIHPVIPTPLSEEQQTLPEVTSVSVDPALPSVRLVIPRSAPARPHVAASSPTSPDNNGKSDGPLIVPQISAQESATAQQEFGASLAAAEGNLGSVRGKKLSAAQTDMANKTKGFIEDAREAARAGDWARARALAKKAQVLSEELARSL